MKTRVPYRRNIKSHAMPIISLNLRTALQCIVLTCLFASPAAGNSQASLKPVEVYQYQGTDRDRRLLEGARREGTVSLYTSLNLKDSVPIAEAFEKKYSGVKVAIWRASS